MQAAYQLLSADHRLIRSGGCCLQIRRWVLDGRRPEVPPREALPGPGSASWPGLDAYCALMR